MVLRWRRNPDPKGLAGVISGPQGSTLRDGDVYYAETGFIPKRFGSPEEGWYWVAREDSKGVPLRNTCNEPVADEATAKADALTYVNKCLFASQKLVFDEWWPLVMRLWGLSGRTKTVKEGSLIALYQRGLAPMHANRELLALGDLHKEGQT